jgi:ureidoacrylate peracid hydrolase
MEVSAGRPMIIEAKPEPITVNCAETAVIVVDMQNDFCSKGGLFDRAGINIAAVRRAVGPTRKTLSATRKAEIKIVYRPFVDCRQTES